MTLRLLASSCLLLAAFAGAAQTAPSWQRSIAYTGLSHVDNLQWHPEWGLFVTLERAPRHSGIMRLAPDGKRYWLARQLRFPDGLLLAGSMLYVTEERTQGRIIRYDLRNKTAKVIARLERPEGIDIRADGRLLISQDSRQGSVVSLDPASGEVSMLYPHLHRPEGLCIWHDQTYVAETLTGRVLMFAGDRRQVVVDHLHEPDQLTCVNNGDLWISEDADPGKLLRLSAGKLELIADDLSYPQGMAVTADGRVYVAEQGKNRIVLFTPMPKT